MGDPQTPHFHDFGISGRVPEPQNQYYSSLETPGYLNKSRKIRGTCSKHISLKSKNSENTHF